MHRKSNSRATYRTIWFTLHFHGIIKRRPLKKIWKKRWCAHTRHTRIQSVIRKAIGRAHSKSKEKSASDKGLGLGCQPEDRERGREREKCAREFSLERAAAARSKALSRRRWRRRETWRGRGPIYLPLRAAPHFIATCSDLSPPSPPLLSVLTSFFFRADLACDRALCVFPLSVFDACEVLGMMVYEVNLG